VDPFQHHRRCYFAYRVCWTLSSFTFSVAGLLRLGQCPGDSCPHQTTRIPGARLAITQFGAIAGGDTDCTKAFAEAIATCHQAGGGRVLVPPGVYLTGPIHLKSRVNLHVSDGATIRFTTNTAAYMPVVFSRFECIELMNYSAPIYAFEQTDIAITGKGTLDGQGEFWHRWI